MMSKLSSQKEQSSSSKSQNPSSNVSQRKATGVQERKQKILQTIKDERKKSEMQKVISGISNRMLDQMPILKIEKMWLIFELK